MSELSIEYHAELKRHNYVTPTSYLELIGAFRSLLDKQRGMVTEAKSRYDVGLQKLTETSEQVAGMQAELVELQPKLVLAGKEADELMLKIEVDTKEANVTRANVTKEEAAATKKADEAQAIKIDCEAGLAEALPALEAAVKALKTLKRDDITEVKSMKSPPAGVKLTMEAVCIMFEIKPVKVAAPDGRSKVWPHPGSRARAAWRAAWPPPSQPTRPMSPRRLRAASSSPPLTARASPRGRWTTSGTPPRR